MCQIGKRLACFIMASVMTLSLGKPVVTASAAPVSNKDVNNAGSETTVSVNMNAEAIAFSVTVPTGLVIDKDAAGNHVCATEAAVKNNTVGPVKVIGVDIKGSNGWTIVPWSTDMQAEKVNSKKVAMTLNSDITGDNTLNFTEENWPVIKGNQELALTYQANTPAQQDAVNGQVANVVFTVGWYGNPPVPPTKPEPVIPADKFIQPGCTYTPVGGETLVAGQIMPDVVKDGDIFTTDDYEYRYNQYPLLNGSWLDYTEQNGWGVRVKDTSKAEYKPLLGVINGQNVTTLESTFANCASLTTAPVIPDSVSMMGSTFLNCSALTTAPVIPNSVTNLNGVFKGCSSLKTAPVLPNSASNMKEAFAMCTSLGTAPVIPASVANMNNTFMGCKALTNAPEIPNGVTNLNGTFRDCTSLTTASVIPTSVTSMSATFSGCTSLKGDVVINASNPSEFTGFFKDCAQDSAHTIILSGTCPVLSKLKATGYNNGQYIIIPKVIPDGCTYTPVGGETLTAGQNMPVIVNTGDIFTTEDYEYHYNQHATPEGIWYDNTKQGGWGVRVKDTTKVAYKPLLSSINGYGVVTLACTFMDCKSMTDAPSIPDSAYSIWKTFSGCSSLKNLPHNGSGYIPKGVKGMAYAFENCSSLYNAPEIPYGVNNTEGAFLNCTALERAPEIPKSVAFASSTFSGCTSLKGDVVINASNPIQIVDYFKDCAQDSAHTILLKGSCPKLVDLKATGYNNGQYIFIPEIVPEGCTYSPNGGEDIPAGGYMPLEVTDNDKFFSEDYVYYYRADKNGWHAIANGFSDKTEFEPLREKINGQSLVDLTSTFALCSNLITAPEIPAGVVIMDNTFWGCSSLVTAPRIPKGVTSMYRTFWDCTSLRELPSLVSFIPDSVENLDSTFLNCSSLERAPLLPDNVTSLSGTYEGCTALTEAGRLPLNVETLTDVFKGCVSLVDPPRIPDGVLYMDSMFEGCTALATAPRLPNGVQDISRSFKGCISLSSAPEIPASVRSMRETFSGCTSLWGSVTINIQYPYADYLDSFKDCAQDAEHTLLIKGTCSKSDKEVIKRTAYNNGQYVTIQ